MAGRLSEDPARVPAPQGGEVRGTVGLLLLRSYLLAKNTGHYDGVISALEARGLRVVPAFAAGLDSRPAIERFFTQDGQALQGTYFKQTFDGLVNRVCHVGWCLATQNFGVQSAGKLGQSPVANANLRPLRLLQQCQCDGLARFIAEGRQQQAGVYIDCVGHGGLKPLILRTPIRHKAAVHQGLAGL
jgi:hypothetical protein